MKPAGKTVEKSSPLKHGLAVHPSLYAADHTRLRDAIRLSLDSGLSTFHFDVMDGAFVPATGLDLGDLGRFRDGMPDISFEVHLMVSTPRETAAHAVRNGANAVSFHPEAATDPVAILKDLKSAGVLAGIAISPGLSASDLARLVEHCDYLVVMLIEPGRTNVKSDPDLIRKLSEIRSCWPDIHLIADGGVSPESVAKVVAAGADTVVVGGALFKNNLPEAYKALQARANAFVDCEKS